MKLTQNIFARLLMHEMLRFSYLYCLILLVSLGWAGNIQAKEIYLLSSLNIHTEYDSNKRLRTGNNGLDKSAYGVKARANAKIGVSSDRYNVELENQFFLNRFASDFNLDSDDFNIILGSNFEITEKLNFSLGGNYRQDTTLTSEISDDNGTGTGNIGGNLDREQWAISPSFTYLLSSTQFFQVSFSHNEVSYEESSSNQFFDFTTDFLSLTFSQQWTNSLRNFISVSAMSFLVPELERDTTEYTINIGVDYQISPTWSTSLTVGRRFTDNEFLSNQPVIINGLPVIINGNTVLQSVLTSEDAQGMVFAFSLNKQLETGHASASYSRSTNSQGNGQQRLVDSFKVNYIHNSSDRLQFSLNGGLVFTSSSGNQNNVDDRKYYNVKPSVKWMFDRHASISMGYQYRMQEFERQSNSAESHSVFVNFNYQWDKLSTQRY